MKLSTITDIFTSLFHENEGDYKSKIDRHDLHIIRNKMRACRSDLQVAFDASLFTRDVYNIGLVVPENTSIITLMHAEGNLQKAFEDVTGRKLDKDNIVHYAPAPALSFIPF
ncbi:MAG: hypothetical protein ACLFR0_03750 [Alphaproteobacteria bacterium]